MLLHVSYKVTNKRQKNCTNTFVPLSYLQYNDQGVFTCHENGHVRNELVVGDKQQPKDEEGSILKS